MSLSEEEQQVIHELEQKLRYEDRAFVRRIEHARPALSPECARLAVPAFIGGFALLLVMFASSVPVASLGFLVMLISSFAFAKHISGREAEGHLLDERERRPDSEC